MGSPIGKLAVVMQEESSSHEAASGVTSRSRKRSAPTFGTTEQKELSKPQGPTSKKAKRVARFFDPREHSWTPQALLQPVSDNLETYAGTMAAPRGPGRPRFAWNDQKTRALIRLVIKSPVCFDDIPAALADPVTGVRPRWVDSLFVLFLH